MASLLDIFNAPVAKTKPVVEKKRIVAESANPARDFVDDLVAWLEHEKTDPERAPGLHCSSLWRTCARVPLLEVLHKDQLKVERLKAGQIMTFDEGHSLHDLIQNNYGAAWGRLWGEWACLGCPPTKLPNGKLVPKVVHTGTRPDKCPECERPSVYADGSLNIIYSEMSVECKELGYRGHCDGLMLDRTLTKKRVFEFKTISKSQYGELRQPKTAHIIQAHAYMHTFGLTEALIVYWDKGSQCDWTRDPAGKWLPGKPHLKAYLVQFSSDVWAPMVERIKAYHQSSNLAKTLPVVSAKDVMKFKRVCSHDKCDLAEECNVREFCFRLAE